MPRPVPPGLLPADPGAAGSLAGGRPAPSPAATPMRPARAPARQARSRATRARLLEATVAVLVERGFAGATTSEICRRAGVSQGALFKHFPSKGELLAETVRHLFAALVNDFRAAFAAAPPRTEPVEAVLRGLASVFAEPRLVAAFELYLAARTDAELHAALDPVLREHRARLRAEARVLFPEAARAHPCFDGLVDAVLDAMQGRAVGALVAPDTGAADLELAALARWLRRELSDLPREEPACRG